MPLIGWNLLCFVDWSKWSPNDIYIGLSSNFDLNVYVFQGQQFSIDQSWALIPTFIIHSSIFFVKATLSPSGKDKKARLEWQSPNEVCFPCSFLFQTLSKILLGLQLAQSQDRRSELPFYIHTWVHTHTVSEHV